jgi:hypothetical protein
MLPLPLSNRALFPFAPATSQYKDVQIFPKYNCQVFRKGSGNRCRNDFICRQGHRHILTAKLRGNLGA